MSSYGIMNLNPKLYFARIVLHISNVLLIKVYSGIALLFRAYFRALEKLLKKKNESDLIFIMDQILSYD